jgi:DNA-binding response OmpR family regulator
VGVKDHPAAGRERLLVVEDDVKLVRVLARGLRREGYAVDTVETGEAALARAHVHSYAVIVLDVMLPDVDGFAVCETLRRRHGSVPVLMLTARSDVADRIRGLDGGADDYMVKPFDFGELLARLRALIRRGPTEHLLVLEAGDLRIDLAARTVTRDGRAIDLTVREFALLEFLARRAGEIVPRGQLIDEVWDRAQDVSPNVVDVYVGYLRRKLERPFGRPLIHTVRGVGYRLEPD